ncbi:putative TNF receptor-associated factor 3 [Paratrimastix pyriformis]|uniref:TNF receptor-associated factor 3 n=1 Tax=Paratrimastix pyriformis TaxID=342808 RepID=A0ABQ8USE3_9EUKA|nr:putative TNF receptor-associated factor 3 [Paratrimastix pyriformis]
MGDESLGGYPQELFVKREELLPELICPICTSVFRKPVSLLCASLHTYCEACIKKWLQKNKTCPIDRGTLPPIEQLYAPNHIVSNIIDRLEIHCSNVEDGCQWAGKVEEVATHQSACEYSPVSCPNVGCSEHLLIRDLAAHLLECPKRRVPCQDCHIEICFQDLESHRATCPQRPMDCPNGCGVRISQGQAAAHDRVCPHLEISCPVRGCGARIIREKLREHLEQEPGVHMTLLVTVVAEQEATIAEMQAALARLQGQGFRTQAFSPLFPDHAQVTNGMHTFRKLTGWSGPPSPSTGQTRFLLRIERSVRGAVEVGIVPRVGDDLGTNYVGSQALRGWALQGKGCGDSQLPTKFGPGCHDQGMPFGGGRNWHDGDLVELRLEGRDLRMLLNGVDQGVAFTGVEPGFFAVSLWHKDDAVTIID